MMSNSRMEVLTGRKKGCTRKTSWLRMFSWYWTKMFSLANSKMSALPWAISRWAQIAFAKAG